MLFSKTDILTNDIKTTDSLTTDFPTNDFVTKDLVTTDFQFLAPNSEESYFSECVYLSTYISIYLSLYLSETEFLNSDFKPQYLST